MPFTPGQRWVSHNDTELGLGVVAETDEKLVVIYYPATDESRTYRINSAPLSRIIYSVDDTVSDRDDNHYTVVDILNHNDLIIYLVSDANGEQHNLVESQLSDHVNFSNPQERLLSGQIDSPNAYKMRCVAHQKQAFIHDSPLRGLRAPRAALLPHQLYIAAEVGRRYAPRVLLADEVGLGKTVEAALIIHQQLSIGHAQRILIVVPDSLINQWLVEMLRRINLLFAVFDEERCAAVADSYDNPFASEQHIICSLSFLTDNPQRHQQLINAGWDLCVVDEAHHLEWSLSEVSEEYLCLEQIARQTPGLLLLTATPDQLGHEGHFGRLRLLDPQRFHDYIAFTEQEAHYSELNQLLTTISEQSVDWWQTDVAREQLAEYIDIAEWQSIITAEAPLQRCIDILLDRHGTGRVLLRNTRTAVGGFPTRQLFPAPLAAPSWYDYQDEREALHPEVCNPLDWCDDDPRVEWLVNHAKANKREKILVICAAKATAMQLEEHLRLRHGVKSADFHEGLSLLERDRAAAYFADDENGAQMLICSEIGSEGRNFQFSKQLVLFDLPRNADLLEQRIGRIDRIGQGDHVELYVPYYENSPMQVLLEWYRDALGIFQAPFAGAQQISEEFDTELTACLSSGASDRQALIADASVRANEVREELASGRDRLLELNSCRRGPANALVEQLSAQDNDPELVEYFDALLEHFGVNAEQHSEHTLVLHLGEGSSANPFPYLSDEGATVTFARNKALSREDMQFITWEHPMVVEATDALLNSESGSCCVTQLSLKGLPAGTLLCEAHYKIVCPAPRHLNLDQYLFEADLRIVCDHQLRTLSEALPQTALDKLTGKVPRGTALQVIKQQQANLKKMLAHAGDAASKQAQPVIERAKQSVNELLQGEIQRLQQLQHNNPLIRTEEIDFLEHNRQLSANALDKASVECVAIRVIVVT